MAKSLDTDNTFPRWGETPVEPWNPLGTSNRPKTTKGKPSREAHPRFSLARLRMDGSLQGKSGFDGVSPRPGEKNLFGREKSGSRGHNRRTIETAEHAYHAKKATADQRFGAGQRGLEIFLSAASPAGKVVVCRRHFPSVGRDSVEPWYPLGTNNRRKTTKGKPSVSAHPRFSLARLRMDGSPQGKSGFDGVSPHRGEKNSFGREKSGSGRHREYGNNDRTSYKRSAIFFQIDRCMFA